jgi:hypothetical protein
MFPVIWHFLFGSWFKSQLGSPVSAAKGSYLDIFWNWKNCHNGDQYFPVWNTVSMYVIPISCGISVTYLDIFWNWKNCHNKKKRCSHCKRCARAKAKDRVRRWRRQVLPVALVVCCWRRSSNKAPRLASDISLPVHWKWKKKKVGLSSVMSELKLSTLQGFFAVDHDFLRLPQLLKTLCNHDYHVSQIKLALD